MAHQNLDAFALPKESGKLDGIDVNEYNQNFG